MKYSRLTKEQFEELHQEFINFLATQSVTADEWANLKVNKPDLAEMELDVFSDLIWEGVLVSKIKKNRKPEEKELHFKEIIKEILASYHFKNKQINGI